MAGTTKRAWKLQEFVAHGANVTCLALGHKSGRVMVTGGDDKKVNMWAVGKPNCIMSLTGHTSPIQAVRFGHAEEMVVAGSLSGALKIWDLEAAKIVRTLTGHKCSIKSLDFHPQGDFVASGSVDTNIKLWDIRRKGCIFTYKGHTGCVNSIRFSPDARWIASASDDGLLKIWDLTAGKLLTDFRHHEGPVTAVEFHPNEFLLATGSEDRTVKFMDLESFKMVSSSEPEASGIRSIAFHPEGSCLYAAMTDHLKVYSWEPTACYDSLTMDWGPVADIAIAQKQLIGATFSNINVSTHVVDVQRVQPLGGPPYTAAPSVAPTPSPPKTASGRRSFVLDNRPHTQATGRRESGIPAEQPAEEVTTPADDPSDDVASFADIQDPANYREVFKPRSKIGHSPTRPVEPFPAPQDEEKPPAPVSSRPPTTSARPQPTPAHSSRPPTSSSRPSSQGTARPSSIQTSRPSSNQNARPISGSPKGPRPTPTISPSRETNTPPEGGDKTNIVPANRNKPVDLNMDDFLPKQQQPIVDRKKTPTDISETEAVSSIVKGHGYMNKVLTSRHKNLQIVRALWTSGNTRTALDSAISMNDLPVIVDLMNVLLQKPGLWSLDLSATVLPQIDDLLQSKYENYAETGCAVIKLVLKNFSHLIKANITAPPSIGVDISREERYNKCKQCYKALMTIRSSVDKKSTTGKLGPQYRELQLLMSQLD